jgi:hypothetical protein
LTGRSATESQQSILSNRSCRLLGFEQALRPVVYLDERPSGVFSKKLISAARFPHTNPLHLIRGGPTNSIGGVVAVM